MRYNILKINPARLDEVIHKGIPSMSTAKLILGQMEENTLAAGEVVESYALAFRVAATGDTYRIENIQ